MCCHQHPTPFHACPAGQTAAAAELYGNWTAAWDRFGGLPEQFDMTMTTVHPIEKVLQHIHCCSSITAQGGSQGWTQGVAAAI